MSDKPALKLNPQPRNRRRKEARPAEIIDAALQQFIATGYQGTRLTDVATRAGITKGTIYLYFPGKEELFKAVVRQVIVSQLQRLEAQVRVAEGSAERVLREVVASFGREFLQTDARHLIPLMVAEGARFPELVDFYYSEVICLTLSILRDVIRRGIDSGEFRDAGLEQFPQIFTSGPIMGLLWQALFGRLQPLDLEKMMDYHLDVVLRGILRPEPDGSTD